MKSGYCFRAGISQSCCLSAATLSNVPSYVLGECNSSLTDYLALSIDYVADWIVQIGYCGPCINNNKALHWMWSTVECPVMVNDNTSLSYASHITCTWYFNVQFLPWIYEEATFFEIVLMSWTLSRERYSYFQLGLWFIDFNLQFFYTRACVACFSSYPHFTDKTWMNLHQKSLL